MITGKQSKGTETTVIKISQFRVILIT